MFYYLTMRWDDLKDHQDRAVDRAVDHAGDQPVGAADHADAPLPLPHIPGATVRTVDTPAFRGITFHEVRAKSIVNRVPAASRMPFRWTINPYRGCSHACVYCFARKSHSYLDLDTGAGFDSQIVVKVNAGELLREKLAGRSWRGEPIAMGTNVDPYQRAEGRYRLMRPIITALRDFANPFSILTKGSLILRDLDLLRQAAEATDVTANVSVGFLDPHVWRSLEPGTPNPRKRLQVCRTLNDAGIGCGVLMAPILPYLTDAPEQLDATVRAIAEAGATHVAPIVLHLRSGGSREWFMHRLAEHRPDLVPRYRRLYGPAAYAPKAYRQTITGRVRELAHRYGIDPSPAAGTRRIDPGRHGPPEQLTLL